MHSHGVCHRDIKPDNVMFCEETGQVKLVDFELARMLKYSTDHFQLLTKTGALHYRAPEMLKGGYDEKADIWAIGVIAYQLFTGKLPFEQEFEAELT